MKKIVAVLLILGVASSAAAGVVPSGVTGLWRFQDSANKLKATVGVDLVSSHPDNSGWFSGPWTVIEPGMSDGGVVQERAWDYLTVNPSFSANGGGSYVNEYTVAIDYLATGNGWNSLFQTAFNGNDSDGDLWIDGRDRAVSTIGVGDIGYSTMTFDSSKWHRIVWSVDNGSFFKVFVDGELFLDGAGQAIDGRWSLYPDRFHLFADNSWEDQWGLVGTVATWNRALTKDEVAGMGGWIGGSATPTELVVPEPATMTLLAIGGILFYIRRKWK